MLLCVFSAAFIQFTYWLLLTDDVDVISLDCHELPERSVLARILRAQQLNDLTVEHTASLHSQLSQCFSDDAHLRFVHSTATVWLGGRVVRTLDLRSTGRGSNPGLSTVECNPGQVVNPHVPLSPSSINWYQPMGGDALRLGR